MTQTTKNNQKELKIYQNESLKNKVTHGVDDESLVDTGGISLFSITVIGIYFSL
jgi:hypothetical protein